MPRAGAITSVLAAALLLGGCGGGGKSGAPPPPTRPPSRPPPTPADFIPYATCMLYAEGADARVRVRAAHVDDACSAVAKRLARSGSHWSRTVRRPADVLSPICRFVDPARRVELEVMDDSANPARGARVCSSLARAGWFDLTSP